MKSFFSVCPALQQPYDSANPDGTECPQERDVYPRDSNEEYLLSMLFIDAPPGPNTAQKCRRISVEIIENIAANSNSIIDDISDDDFEDEQPCGMNELISSNSNTHHNDKPKIECSIVSCSYKAQKGWKQLTKHYARQHPTEDMPNSYLSKNFNIQKLKDNIITSVVTEGPNGMFIKSMCYICNESYRMCSEKWLMHFISHTG